MRLADGRELAWIEVGDPAGVAAVAFHGSPGCGLGFAPHGVAARRCGVWLIAVDRPGYGQSSYQPGRRLAAWADDVRQLADRLGLDRFGVLGHSAGGPHALACARFLPDRLLGCAVVSGPAPQAQVPMTDGMLLSNRIQTAIYRRWPPEGRDAVAVGLWHLARPFLAPLLWYGRRHAEREVDRTLGKVLPECDLIAVSRPDVRATLVHDAATFTTATLRASVQDMALGIREWGFDPADIVLPVQVWHGDLDRNIPIAHAQRLAALIPNATLHRCPGEGHWLLVDHMDEVLPAVTSRSPGR